MKHGGGGGGGNRAGPSNSNFSHHAPQPPPPPPVYPFYRLATPNAYGSLMPDPSTRGEPSFRGTRPAAGFVSQSHPVNDHRNFSRRGNFGSHPHGDGAYQNNYGGRRDQDRGNFANTRDPHMQPPRGPPLRGFARPAPPNAPPFMAQSIRNPMGFQGECVFYKKFGSLLLDYEFNVSITFQTFSMCIHCLMSPLDLYPTLIILTLRHLLLQYSHCLPC